MRSLTIQFSGLIGTLTSVSQVTGGTPLETAIYLGLATAAAIFLVMFVGDLAIRAIMKTNSPSPAPPADQKRRGRESGDRPDALAA